MQLENWATQARKGVLELCILAQLRNGELYGYDITKSLSRLPGVVVAEGTVYLIMSRLKKDGLLEARLVESSTGPARKYYSLSKRGRIAADQMLAHWQELAKAVNKFVRGGPNG